MNIKIITLIVKLVSFFLFNIFFYIIYFLNSIIEEKGKIIPKLTIDLDKMKKEFSKNEVLLLNNKIFELQIIIKDLEAEVYNLYN